MSDTTYLQFDLLIDRGATGYRVRVLNSPAGQASGALTLPPDFAASADWSAPAAARCGAAGSAPVRRSAASK